MPSQLQHQQEPIPTLTSPKLLNRGHATGRLAAEMARVMADSSYRFSILLVEMDGLNDSFDRLGYASQKDGRARTLGFLTKDLRPDDLCCQLSEDEFLLILSGTGDKEAEALAHSLRGRWNPAGSQQEDVLLSIGIASYPTHGCSIEQLLCAADQAAYTDRLAQEERQPFRAAN